MALVDHVVVLDHLQEQTVMGPPTQTFGDVLRKQGVPEDAIAAIPVVFREQSVGAEGEAEATHAALDFRSSGVVTPTAWSCSCGADLHSHWRFVLMAWAEHVGQVEGIDPDHLAAHAIVSIDATWHPQATPRVTCRCGDFWNATGYTPGDALDQWEAHVRAS